MFSFFLSLTVSGKLRRFETRLFEQQERSDTKWQDDSLKIHPCVYTQDIHSYILRHKHEKYSGPSLKGLSKRQHPL